MTSSTGTLKPSQKISQKSSQKISRKLSRHGRNGHGFRLGLALAAITLLGGVTACAPTVSQTPESELVSGDAQADFVAWSVKYVACMKDQGIDMSSNDNQPSTDGGGLVQRGDEKAREAAAKVCSEKVGEPPVQEGTQSDTERETVMLAYAKCMRAAGYDYPDPDFSGNGLGTSLQASENLDPADLDRCRSQSGLSGKGSSEMSRSEPGQ